MTADMIAPSSYDTTGPTLVLVSANPTTLIEQQAFLTRSEYLLRRASVSGQRLVTTLFHILTAHSPIPVDAGPSDASHYACRECRPDGRLPAQQYPCPTAQEAAWALDAVLR